MAMRDYALHVIGAIIFDEDFDPTKVIKVIADECGACFCELTRNAISNGIFNDNAAKEICGELNVPYKAEDIKSFSVISNILLDDKRDWFDGEDRFMGNDEIGVELFTDIEGVFRYTHQEDKTEQITECLMFTLTTPFPWEIDNYTGPRSKEQVIRLLQEVSKPLLKDNIDWESRLGELLGTVFG